MRGIADLDISIFADPNRSHNNKRDSYKGMTVTYEKYNLVDDDSVYIDKWKTSNPKLHNSNYQS